MTIDRTVSRECHQGAHEACTNSECTCKHPLHNAAEFASTDSGSSDTAPPADDPSGATWSPGE